MAATRSPEELYYLPEDPYEINNLADDPAHRDKLVELRQVLDAWLAEVDTASYPKTRPPWPTPSRTCSRTLRSA